MGITDWFSKKERVTVFEAREHEVVPTSCVVDREFRLVRSRDATGSWPLPEFDATRVGKERAFVAIGPKIVPWPTNDKPAWDVMDDGTKIEITPEHIDQVAEHAHKLGRLAAVGEMSMMDRIIHMAAGAAIGLVLGFVLIKYLGFSIVHGNGGTVVTITNTTANTTAPGGSLANAAMLPILARFGRFKVRARCACEAKRKTPRYKRDSCAAYEPNPPRMFELAGMRPMGHCVHCGHDRACHEAKEASA